MARRAVVSGQTTDLGARFQGAAEAGGGIQAGAHPEVDVQTPLDRAVAGAKRVVRGVTRALTPGAASATPIGNSSIDAHNQRAAEFAMSEAERQRLLKRLDANIASDKAKAGKK